jgi:hypothetical protein
MTMWREGHDIAFVQGHLTNGAIVSLFIQKPSWDIHYKPEQCYNAYFSPTHMNEKSSPLYLHLMSL